MTTICNAALAALALMGYSLPDWFQEVLGIILILFVIGFILHIPKLLNMICGSNTVCPNKYNNHHKLFKKCDYAEVCKEDYEEFKLKNKE